ncbi:DUF4169 family protein [Parvularcula sp. LCG005]|uniref:DUF4169 family protein n=1 Tax=Parvularcula sp. LCG005 TaxID=3078805 RepID=UPI003978F497
MAEIINLRQARKARSRQDKEKRAAENRAFYGLSKDQREIARRIQERQAKDVDQTKLDSEQDDGPETA